MRITALLIEPALEQIKNELQELAIQVSEGKKSFNGNPDLLVKVCSLLSDLVDLKKEVEVFNPQDKGVIPVSFYEGLRKLKLETHFTRRIFLKLKSNEARFEKMAARRNDVSTVAA